MKLSHILYISILAFMATACSSSNQNMSYFTDIDSMPEIEVGEYLNEIEPSDQLIITVTSKDNQATADYNLPYVNVIDRNSTTRMNSGDQQTYTVDSQGYIDFPVLGKIYVKGMTTEDLKDLLTREISKDVEDPIVTVNFTQQFINVLGEVGRPGRVWMAGPRFTIFDALAAAGDLNQYGKRENVLLIREEDGKRKHIRFNLNSAESLTSPYIYMKQYDLIYVEPNNIRKDNAEYNTYNAYKLSMISTIVSGSVGIISLIIAFTR